MDARSLDEIDAALGSASAGRPNGSHGPDEPRAGLPFALLDWAVETRFAGEPPRPRWLVHETIPLGVPGMVAAMGDTGKSFLCLDLAFRLVTRGIATPFDRPAKPIFNGRVSGSGSAVIITAEDTAATVHRRLAAIEPNFAAMVQASGHVLAVVPLADLGAGPLVLLEEDRGRAVLTPAFDQLLEEARTIPDLRLIVLDPLQALCNADVNADPSAAQMLCAALARLAAETGATVLVTHHMRKPDRGGNLRNGGDARAAIRGTTALVDGLRFAIAIWPAEDDEARAACAALREGYEPGKVARMALVKSNERADRRVRTLVRDASGVLVDRSADLAAGAPSREALLSVLAEAIGKAAAAGHPYKLTARHDGLFARRESLPGPLDAMSRNRLETLGKELIESRRIVACSARGSGTTKHWLDLPDGPVARGEVTLAKGADMVEEPA